MLFTLQSHKTRQISHSNTDLTQHIYVQVYTIQIQQDLFSGVINIACGSGIGWLHTKQHTIQLILFFIFFTEKMYNIYINKYVYVPVFRVVIPPWIRVTGF